MALVGDFSKIGLDVGELIYNEGEVDELSLGFTQGGSFTDGLVVREIEVDGKRAPLKGDRVIDTYEPVLEFNLLQMESAKLDKAFHGITIADAAGIKTLTRDIAIVDADYMTNITWVGTLKDGKSAKIVLENALGFAPMSFTFADKTEIQIPCSFMGHNTAITDTTAPYSLIIDEA